MTQFINCSLGIKQYLPTWINLCSVLDWSGCLYSADKYIKNKKWLPGKLLYTHLYGIPSGVNISHSNSTLP